MGTKALTLGERMFEWRTAVGLKQKEVSDRAGLSQSVWSDLESNKTIGITLDVARRVSAVTSGVITLEHFPRVPGKRVRPVRMPEPDLACSEADVQHVRATG